MCVIILPVVQIIRNTYISSSCIDTGFVKYNLDQSYILKKKYLYFSLVFAQQHGDLRLAGNQATFGRLEIYIPNAWGTICIDGFTMESANTACRQLGRANAIDFTTVDATKWVLMSYSLWGIVH